MQGKTLPKGKLIMVLGVILGISGVLLWYANRPGILRVTTDAAATIYITTSRDAEFKEIGKGEATYKTRTVPSEVFVMVQNGDSKTISGAVLEKGKTVVRNLSLNPVSTATLISEGGLSSPFIDGSLVQGIFPEDFSLISYRTDKYESVRPEFIGMPEMKKLVWFDANNFIYSSFNEGVGRFVNGEDIGSRGLADAITGGFTSIQSPGIDSIVDIVDVAQYPSKPLVLISKNNIFLSDDRGTSLRTIASFDAEDEANTVQATKDRIMRFAVKNPSSYASEEGENDNHSTTVYQYDYSGKELPSIDIPDESVISTASHNANMYFLTNSSLVSKGTGDMVRIPLYFSFLGNLTTYKNTPVLLAGDGLWKVSDDGTALQLIFPFSGLGVGLRDSLTTTTDGRLIFGTTPAPNDEKNNSKLFSISF